jgi:hypothetical protein
VGKFADIRVWFNYNEAHWIVSDSSNESDDFATSETAAVEAKVSEWRLQLEHLGYQVKVLDQDLDD